MLRETNAYDLALAIRDLLEDRTITQFEDQAEYPQSDTIDFVDISDPHSPVIHMASGPQFTLHIVPKED